MRNLEQAIEESGLKRDFIAKQLKITPASLGNKVNGKTEWKPSEIVRLKEIFSFSDAEVMQIFLS